MHESDRGHAARDARQQPRLRLGSTLRRTVPRMFLSQGEESTKRQARLTKQRWKKQRTRSRAGTSWQATDPRLTSCFFWRRHKRFPPAPATKSGGYFEAGGDRTQRAERSETDMSATTDSTTTSEEQQSSRQPTESAFPFEPTCTCLGCHDPATKVIDHPDHGRRVVCDDDAEGYEVIERV